MGPIVCVVLDVAGLGDDPGARAHALFAAGADWIQLRDRHVDDRALLEVARALVTARDAAPVGGTHRRVIVNRRTDVALSAGADGVHLGFDALAAIEARRLLGPEAAIGRSLHTLDEVEAAAIAREVDYVHLAPIWDPHSKPATRPALGPEALARACASGLPVLAQGGIGADRAAEAVACGAAGVALTGDLARGVAPESVLAPLRQRLEKTP